MLPARGWAKKGDGVRSSEKLFSNNKYEATHTHTHTHTHIHKYFAHNRNTPQHTRVSIAHSPTYSLERRAAIRVPTCQSSVALHLVGNSARSCVDDDNDGKGAERVCEGEYEERRERERERWNKVRNWERGREID